MTTHRSSARTMMKKNRRSALLIVFAWITAANLSAQNNALYIDSTGRVGIGTSTPTQKLVVNGTTLLQGNVGINQATPEYKLTIGGNDNVFGVDNSAIFTAKNASGSYERYFWPRWSDNVMYMNYGANGFNLRNNTNASAFFIKSDGNAGIGTVNPTTKLEVAGRVKDQSGYITPQGGIMMYGGSEGNFDNSGKGKPDSPVAGWAICNGLNGTPDLRNRFIVGAGPGSNYSIGSKGGEDFHTLTTAEMPRHTHRYGYECYDVVAAGQSGCWLRRNGINNGDETQPAGESKPHENRPPYFAMLYIMKL
ncbi:MAG: hypothetical protein ABW019_00610 [Chitinophagaceae bacterium]